MNQKMHRRTIVPADGQSGLPIPVTCAIGEDVSRTEARTAGQAGSGTKLVFAGDEFDVAEHGGDLSVVRDAGWKFCLCVGECFQTFVDL